MSKIYQALRQHEQESRPAAPPPRAPQPSAGDDLIVANHDMQALYRSVEAALAQVEGGAMVMFSSARPGEGKTTVCGGFATVAAANFGRAVLILDGDRKHALSRRFNARDGLSVATLVESPEAVLQGAKRVGPRGAVAVVPVASLVGVANSDTQELDLLAVAKERLAKTFDYVLIDPPSVADVPWSPSLGRLADGVILVVEAERTRWPVVANAKTEFENSGAKILGVFLNKRRFYIPRVVYKFI